ncbi:hypothetical protein HBI56_086440 [Parastagonospora nodorum]|uniref:EF-hand domain-containing protein n=1 Tax=Phaeosphaeria nodorum (strain SN15 / ATCC MYA-4574 / FGSC 10173) TaxID=321614 RepID=A0A7U2FE26_PHANO|nr:hypothetical protein HBH56_113160 [Parastagonospora nodorum]QRD03557.1 hypothetical protein JI435_103230 [Parastagonospora nodorum SN15]KAH3921565.1 hypothetical protein HBH54_239310 [Parastagonospora nodorum]KAH3951220.1 hypothetical protein HBH53_068820 [Parastagonospora nodorum]KAH3962945.1 hypothetical protein HBH51_169490 [Parastagonospora nodorum]
MSGIVNKVKDILHKDKDTTDTTHSSHTTGTGHSSTTGHNTTGHSTINPADRNNDGKVDARDVTGTQHGATGGLSGHNTVGHNTTTGGLSGHNTAGHSTINPADRNNDGRVDARDLTGSNTTGGLAGHNTSHGTAGGLGSHSTTGHSTTGGLGGHSTTSHSTSSGLTGALAQDASFAPTGQHNTRTADILDPHVSSGTHGHSGATTGGLGHGTTGSGLTGHGTANPIDRNNDGRVNARDLTGGGATGHSSAGGIGHSTAGGLGSSTTGGVGHTANPVDRNNDGRVDAHDLTGRGNTGHSTTGGLAGHSTTGGLAGHSAAGGLGGHSAAGGLGHTANPADRNNDGRVDARDLTGQGHSTTGGLGHSTGGAGGLGHTSTGAGLGHSSTGAGGLGHSSTGAGLGHTANPIDRNNDGRVNAHDLTGSSNTGHHGPPVTGGLDHRAGESGDLPRALTEDVSRAQPAGFTEGHTGFSDSRHTSHGVPTHGSSTANTSTYGSSTTGTTGTTGTSGTTAGKPSLKDKLNPKIDADRDGKAGIMD